MLRVPNLTLNLLVHAFAGIDPGLSNQARWMNHANEANVVWKKQKLGPKPAMHFYTRARVLPGDELCFDYGDEYWDALGVTPL